VGRTRKNTAPQKVRPNPMKAKTCELLSMDAISARTPGMMSATLILPAREGCFSFRRFFKCSVSDSARSTVLA